MLKGLSPQDSYSRLTHTSVVMVSVSSDVSTSMGNGIGYLGYVQWLEHIVGPFWSERCSCMVAWLVVVSVPSQPYPCFYLERHFFKLVSQRD